MKHKFIISLIGIAFAVVFVSACSMADKNSDKALSSSQTSRAGSLARFNVVGDYLYTVTPSKLNTISLANKEKPAVVNSIPLSFYTETIFPYKDFLLLGTDNGMFIYNISAPATPMYKSFFEHVRSCDPVVAQNGYAYLTLNSGNLRCSRGRNQLQIIDIQNIERPKLISEMEMDKPMGLDINDTLLYVCDNGLRVIDVSDKKNPKKIGHYSQIEPHDVIQMKNRLILIGKDGLHQYQIEKGNLKKLSSINTQF